MVAEAVPGDVASTRTPFGINLAVGAIAMAVAAGVDAALFSGIAVQLVVMALAVGVYAALVDDTRAAVVTAGLGLLLFTGFLANRYGELTWDGTTTLWHLVAFILAAGLGLGLRWIRTAQAEAAVAAELGALLTNPISNEKESHGA